MFESDGARRGETRYGRLRARDASLAVGDRGCVGKPQKASSGVAICSRLNGLPLTVSGIEHVIAHGGHARRMRWGWGRRRRRRRWVGTRIANGTKEEASPGYRGVCSPLDRLTRSDEHSIGSRAVPPVLLARDRQVVTTGLHIICRVASRTDVCRS